MKNSLLALDTIARQEALRNLPNPEERKQVVFKAWGNAESRFGKFVNLDEDTLHSLMICPDDKLVEIVEAGFESHSNCDSPAAQCCIDNMKSVLRH